MLRPTGRGLSRSGKAARTGRAAAPGSEGGKLTLNLVRVTIRALQVGVGVFHATQHTRGLLLRRPIKAITPFIPIGKEIERRSQEGEDISIFDNAGPVKYHPRKTANTRPADAALILRATRFSKKLLRRESGASQHAIDRFFRGERIHPGTRKKLAQTVEELERKRRSVIRGTSTL